MPAHNREDDSKQGTRCWCKTWYEGTQMKEILLGTSIRQGEKHIWVD